MQNDTPKSGLPWWERTLLRLFIAVGPRFIGPKKAFSVMEKEIQKSLVLFESVDPSRYDEVVQIPRVFGIEKSSCNYSLFMVIEHLVMVDMGLMKLIGALNHEKSVVMAIDPAAVKSQKNSDQRRIFSMMAKKYEQVVVEAAQRSKTKHPHPWFGLLDNYQWHLFVAYHHRIHRRQMEAIIKRLPGRVEETA